MGAISVRTPIQTDTGLADTREKKVDPFTVSRSLARPRYNRTGPRRQFPISTVTQFAKMASGQ